MKKIKISKLQLESILADEYNQPVNEEPAYSTYDNVNYKPDYKVALKKYEVEHINSEANLLYNELFTGEGVAAVNSNEHVKQEIINDLIQSGIKIDHDAGEGEMHYWISDVNELDMAEREFEDISSHLYNQIEN
jgi:hypothetical protein